MKVVMSIAGSDSSGGAGVQADLKTFEAFGVFGTSVITVVTAQNTTGVRGVEAISVENIQAQIEAVLEDFDVSAIKIGMLFSAEIIEMVLACIKDLSIPIVLDPVFISKAGAALLQDDAVEAMKKLFGYATVMTPNQFEAKALFGYDEHSIGSVASSPCPVLVKNHVAKDGDSSMSIDELYMGSEKKVFQTPYLQSNNLHGTGCSFSSAIAANLALGYSLNDSIERAKSFIYNALKHAPSIGHGPGPIMHREGVK
jgi:hydroxymethylpyrimidine/phosphomethylpyrimidine kinase